MNILNGSRATAISVRQPDNLISHMQDFKSKSIPGHPRPAQWGRGQIASPVFFYSYSPSQSVLSDLPMKLLGDIPPLKDRDLLAKYFFKISCCSMTVGIDYFFRGLIFC